MARFSLSQTWSVGPVCVTMSAVGDPAPPDWAVRMGPVVEAIEEALAVYETDAYPVMRRADIATDVDEDEDAAGGGE